MLQLIASSRFWKYRKMPISQITGASIQDGSIVVADLGITTFNTGTGNTLTLQANSATGLVIDVTGNTAIANTLSFTGTGSRIRGNFSVSSPSGTFFQTSTANSISILGVVPNGTALNSGFRAFGSSTPADCVFGDFFVNSTATLVQLRSHILGTASYVPLTFATGGSECLRLDTSGNMMLGTTSVSSSTKFDVYGNSSAAHVGARVTNEATNGYSTLWLSSSNDGLVRGGSTAGAFTSELAMLTSGSIPLTFYTTNTKRMTIGATGNIGIGTTSPSQLLHVAAGTILASNTSSTTATVSIAGNGSTTGTSDFALQQGTSSEAYVFNRANSFLVLGTNNTERMRITSAGIISIGTNGPAGDFRMTLAGDDTINPGLVALNNQTATQVSATLYASSSFGWTGTRSNHSFIFLTNGTERMRLDTSGNLGIGTGSPERRLHLRAPTTCDMTIQCGNTTDYSYLYFGDSASATQGWVGYYNTEDSMRFGTNNGERMRIDSSGNVGIGTSTIPVKLTVLKSGTSTTAANLFAGGLTAAIIDGEPSLAFSSNIVAATGLPSATETAKGGIGFSYVSNTAPTEFNVGIWGSPTVASSVRFFNNTERMRITSGGDVVIGATSAIFGARFGVKSSNNTLAAFSGADASGTSYFVTTNGSGQINHYATYATSGVNCYHAWWVTTSVGGQTQAMTLDVSGNFTIGSSAAGGARINSYATATGGRTLYLSKGTGDTTDYFIVADTTTQNRFLVFGTGNVQNTNNSYGGISDVKLKENIVDATPKLEDLCKVKVRNYNFKFDPDHKQIGVIAQELEQVFAGLVEETKDTDKDGNDLGTTTKAVKYSVFVPMLIKAIQELKAELDATKAEVELLKKLN